MRAVADAFIDDHQAVRPPAGHAELLVVEFVEQLRLFEIPGAVEVTAEFVPARVEQADDDILFAFAALRG